MIWSQSGRATAAGDINGDGFDDILVGAYVADNNAKADSGSAYLVFGKASGWASTLGLSTLNGTTGFRLDGSTAGDKAGASVAFDDTCGSLSGLLAGGAESIYDASGGGAIWGIQGRDDAMSSTYDLNTIIAP